MVEQTRLQKAVRRLKGDLRRVDAQRAQMTKKLADTRRMLMRNHKLLVTFHQTGVALDSSDDEMETAYAAGQRVLNDDGYMTGDSASFPTNDEHEHSESL